MNKNIFLKIKDPASIERRDKIDRRIESMQKELNGLTTAWQEEREKRREINVMKEKLESTRYELEMALRNVS